MWGSRADGPGGRCMQAGTGRPCGLLAWPLLPHGSGSTPLVLAPRWREGPESPSVRVTVRTSLCRGSRQGGAEAGGWVSAPDGMTSAHVTSRSYLWPTVSSFHRRRELVGGKGNIRHLMKEHQTGPFAGTRWGGGYHGGRQPASLQSLGLARGTLGKKHKHASVRWGEA